ncbi:MAG: hypothetical protein QMD77_03345 [Patescibacteria group bacterium]|nr:hypothetical protein [Patescibacteria group bacterium]
MPQPLYQEPIEKEDLDLAKKIKGETPVPNAQMSPESVKVKGPETQGASSVEKSLIKEEKTVPLKIPETKETEPSGPERETGAEVQEEKIGEKIETARKTIGAQKQTAKTSVSDDAGTISQITEYEKKVEKLVGLALQRGPEHAIKVAQHLDKGKSVFEADNYTLDEIHDRLLEDELRKQLIAKGLLKEL